MLNWSVQEALVFTLLIFRSAGLMMITPFFGSTAIPIRIRLMFSIVLSYCIIDVVPRTMPANHIIASWNLGDYLLNVLGEVAVGSAMGLICLAMFSAIIYAGQVIDQSLGLSVAELIDPFTQQQGTVTGQLQFYLFMVVFLMLNGHLQLLEVFIESVSRVPMAYVSVNNGFIEIFMGVLDSALQLTIRFAAPVMFLAFLINLALGFMSKAVPTMNVFILGFPVKTLMGLGLLMVVLGQIMSYATSMTEELVETEYKVLEVLNNG